MVLGVIIVLLLLFIIHIYNKMRVLSIKVDETFSNIDVILKQRFDTLNNLISTVKGYMKHEQETLVRVVELRNYLKNPSLSDVEKTNANNELSREIPSLLAVAESYPELKADNQFLQLQKTITYLEDNLAASRRTFNAMINQYNAYIETFPALLFAKLFGFTRKQYFVSKDEERQNVHPTF